MSSTSLPLLLLEYQVGLTGRIQLVHVEGAGALFDEDEVSLRIFLGRPLSWQSDNQCHPAASLARHDFFPYPELVAPSSVPNSVPWSSSVPCLTRRPAEFDKRPPGALAPTRLVVHLPSSCSQDFNYSPIVLIERALHLDPRIFGSLDLECSARIVRLESSLPSFLRSSAAVDVSFTSTSALASASSALLIAGFLNEGGAPGSNES